MYFLLNYSPFSGDEFVPFPGCIRSIRWDPHLGTKSRALSKSQRCFAAFAAYHQCHSHCCEHAPEAPWLFLFVFLKHQLTKLLLGGQSFWRSVQKYTCLLLVWGGHTPSHMLHGTVFFTYVHLPSTLCLAWAANIYIIVPLGASGIHLWASCSGKRVEALRMNTVDPPNDTHSQGGFTILQKYMKHIKSRHFQF